MKRAAYLLPFLLCACIPAIAQHKLSWSVYAGSGISWFGGKEATKTATYYRPATTAERHYVDQPYGKQAMTNWSAGIQVECWNKTNLNIALLAQLEYTGGKTPITKVASGTGTVDADGEFMKGATFISLNPQAGRIFTIGKHFLFLRAGIDYAFHMDGTERFRVPDQNGDMILTGDSGFSGNNDIRLTSSVLIPLSHKLLIDVSYKHGIRKYGDSNAYLRAFHARLSYDLYSPKRSHRSKF